MRNKYDLAFKKEVMRKYLSGQTMASIARETGVSENVLYRGKQKMVTTADVRVKASVG